MQRYISRISIIILLVVSGYFLSCTRVLNDDVEKMGPPRVRIIAHRGCWLEKGSQNTLESINRAVLMGVNGIEFDVRITQDDSAVVVHDASVEGLVIAKTSFSRLRQIRLGNGEPIPTLNEFLNVAKKYPSLELFIELKTTQAIPKVLDIVESAQLKNHVVFISFLENALKSVSAIKPNAELGFIRRNGQGINGSMEELSCYSYLVYQMGVLEQNPEIIETATEEGICIIPWLIDDLNSFYTALDLGAGYIISNNPGQLILYQ